MGYFASNGPGMTAIFYGIPSESGNRKHQADLESICRTRLAELYGDDQQAQERLETELTFVSDTQSAKQFLIAREVSAYMRSHGDVSSLVSSGSLIDFLTGATRINPLPPHYRCPNCCRIEYSAEKRDGFDLPRRKCPSCGLDMLRDGHALSPYLYWADSKRSLDYPTHEMRASHLHLQELQRVLDRSVPPTGGTGLYRRFVISQNPDAKALAALTKATGVDILDVPIEPDGSFYDLVRRFAYDKASFSTETTPEDLRRSDFYITRDEVFDLLLGQGISPDQAAVSTYRLVWGHQEKLAIIPEHLQGNIPIMRNIWSRAACAVYVMWRLQLQWFERNYPVQYREVCGDQSVFPPV